MYKLTKYAKRLFHAHLNGQKLSNIDLIALNRMKYLGMIFRWAEGRPYELTLFGQRILEGEDRLFFLQEALDQGIFE